MPSLAELQRYFILRSRREIQCVFERNLETFIDKIIAMFDDFHSST